LNPGERLDRSKQRLRAELPEYMVPLHWLWLDRLPLNANGKLDRKALPALEIGQLHSQEYLAPRNELEQTLAGIWAEVLKVERVGVQDNFFELGGHSLLATQIASRVQKTLQRDVPLRAMFECSTVEALAGYIDGLAANEISAEKVDRLSDLMAELEGF
ncbi:MAG: phosphopantetheine-binding protein, partial [Pseudomonas sp.]